MLLRSGMVPLRLLLSSLSMLRLERESRLAVEMDPLRLVVAEVQFGQTGESELRSGMVPVRAFS